MKSPCPTPSPFVIPGTHTIDTLPGPVTRVDYFPRVNFFAPLGAPVSADMRGSKSSVTPNAAGDGYVVLGEVDLGGCVLNAEELSALPGFTEFFPALLEAGLAKLAAQGAEIENELPPEGTPAP